MLRKALGERRLKESESSLSGDGCRSPNPSCVAPAMCRRGQRRHLMVALLGWCTLCIGLRINGVDLLILRRSALSVPVWGWIDCF